MAIVIEQQVFVHIHIVIVVIVCHTLCLYTVYRRNYSKLCWLETRKIINRKSIWTSEYKWMRLYLTKLLFSVGISRLHSFHLLWRHDKCTWAMWTIIFFSWNVERTSSLLDFLLARECVFLSTWFQEVTTYELFIRVLAFKATSPNCRLPRKNG